MDDFNSIEQTPEEKFEAVGRLKKSLEENFVSLGGLLSEIKRSKIFKLRGYKNFKDFIETEYAMAGSFASKLIGINDLFIQELDINEQSLKQIGFDKLNMIKPLVKDCAYEETEAWLGKAEGLPTPELREEVKTEKERRNRKDKTLKEIFIDQFFEKMTTSFNCSRKDLNYKLAIYFQDMDLTQVKDSIRLKQRKLEEAEQMEGMPQA